MSDTLSPDDAATFGFLVKKLETAQAAINIMAEHLGQKYGIAPPDALMMDGRIVRAPKPEPFDPRAAILD